MDKRCLVEDWWQYRYWMGRLNTWALIAAVFLFSVQVQPRAQSANEQAPVEESVAGCPCGNPAGLVPVATWPTDVADCAADSKRATLYGFSFEGGVASLASTAYGRDCQFVVDATALDSQAQPISQPQVNACSVLIIS